MRRARPVVGRLLLSLLALVAVYLLLLAYPEPFFPYRVSRGGLRLAADRPLPSAAASVLDDAARRLSRSPLSQPGVTHRLFLCQDLRRFAFFTNVNRRSGGICYVFPSPTIFLRRADVAKGRLFGPSGRLVPGERTLAYFLAHEATHGLEVRYLGQVAYFLRLPIWVREGYADYVARGGQGALDLRQAAAQVRSGAREMDPARSHLYLRYHFLVAYLLDVEHLSVRELLHSPPAQAAVEARAIALR